MCMYLSLASFLAKVPSVSMFRAEFSLASSRNWVIKDSGTTIFLKVKNSSGAGELTIGAAEIICAEVLAGSAADVTWTRVLASSAADVIWTGVSASVAADVSWTGVLAYSATDVILTGVSAGSAADVIWTGVLAGFGDIPGRGTARRCRN